MRKKLLSIEGISPNISSFLKASADTDPDLHIYDPEKYYQMLDQELLNQPTLSLSELQEKIQHAGLCTVLPYASPADESIIWQLNYLYGTPLHFADYPDLHQKVKQKKLKAVALHPGNSANTARVFVGSANPHIHYLHGKLDKWEEYIFAERYMPSAMPETFRLCDVKSYESEELVTQRRIIADWLDAAKKNRNFFDHLTYINLIYKYIETLKDKLSTEFPEEMIIKHRLGCGTGDCGDIVFLSKLDTTDWREKYLAEIHNADLKITTGDLLSLGCTDIAIIHDAIFNPKNIIIQRYIPIARMDSGSPMEFRVAFLAGEAMFSTPRHSYRCYLREQDQATTFLNEFFLCVPKYYRYLSGEADIAFDKKQRPFIVEFNFGADGYLNSPGLYYNLIVSKLMKKDTPMVALLNQLIVLPPVAQRAFLNALKASKFPYDIPFYCAMYHRDRMLSHWMNRQLPKEQGDNIEQTINCVFSGNTSPAVYMRHAALSFIEREKSLQSISRISFFVSGTNKDRRLLKNRTDPVTKRNRSLSPDLNQTIAKYKHHRTEDESSPPSASKLIKFI